MTPENPRPARFATDAILYSFRRCPYAMRARMALAVSGADPEQREVVLARKPVPMLEAGTAGTVPLLVLDEGTVLEESLDIMDWSLSVSDPCDWLRARQDPSLCALVELNDDRFKAAVDRYKYPQRRGLQRDDQAASEGATCLQALEQRLTQRYIGGSSPDFFDAALFPFVRQFAAVDEAWFNGLPLPNVQAWRAQMLVHPAFTTVMRKVPEWAVGAPPTRFRACLVSPCVDGPGTGA